jgi:dipeptidyl aminopeptidase/acylaminoacyl peptidase
VDGARCAIDGGSAGGFTTLCALTFDPSATFQAGCSLYGVADLSLLAGDTHKFESRYLDSLVGAWPQDAHVYKARAPAENTHLIKCPVLFLQVEQATPFATPCLGSWFGLVGPVGCSCNL